jgi:hypothetical protein
MVPSRTVVTVRRRDRRSPNRSDQVLDNDLIANRRGTSGGIGDDQHAMHVIVPFATEVVAQISKSPGTLRRKRQLDGPAGRTVRAQAELGYRKPVQKVRGRQRNRQGAAAPRVYLGATERELAYD